VGSTPPRALRPRVDQAIELLVLGLLEKVPEHRPASAQDVFDRLRPFLPAPGESGVAPGSYPGALAGSVPDPTRPYRHPLAPHRPTAPQAVPQHAPASPAPAAVRRQVLPAALVEELDIAEQQATDLIDQERFSQAADILDDVLSSSDARALTNHPRLLEIRSTHAAALFLGGDFRRALAAFDELAAAYTSVAGPRDDRVLECRKQAAYCHAELGDTEAALAGFQALLDHVRTDRDDRSPEALELRHQIGILLLAAHRLREAAQVLRPLHQDLLTVRGVEDPDVQEVRDLLTRIQLTGGTWR
jgi:tetratricopeptide (TPR) repeat protein